MANLYIAVCGRKTRVSLQKECMGLHKISELFVPRALKRMAYVKKGYTYGRYSYIS